MEFILLILILLMIAQIFLVVKKGNSISHLDDLSKINELMLYVDKRQVNMTNEKGMNALMIACANSFYTKKGEFGYFDVVKKAITSGFDLDAKSLSSGKTPLMYAIRNQDGLEMAKYLLDAGANPNTIDNNARTVLFDAIKRRDKQFYDLIINKISNVNHSDSYGVNTLMIATYHMKIEIIEDLLDRGADAKLCNKAGQNSYDIASQYMPNHIKIAIESDTSGETGKAKNITSSEDVLAAQKHNHDIREMVRRLKCLVDDEIYEYKKFKRPFLNNKKAR